MREPVSSTIDPPPHVRGQIRGVSDWTQLVPRTRADAQRIKIEQTALGKQAAVAAKQRHTARLREIAQIATWPRHASSDTTPRPTTRVVPRRTESGSRIDTRAIYARFNAPSSATPATPAPPPPSSPARARSLRDIARDAYRESASADASLVSASARGGR